ncbi:DUF4234 domain-containing protein [Enterobacter asburiae]|uniref:DUF4234 domain-containing protein n=1 Tax=Enterobacter asburiae TaxID=61645 RepID=UPI00192C6D96|nr:DUF4234 domain-containing protein [Enterobacter asburiae]MBL5945850.1 DUF4234 domain-containing protein [Enterobacter asburiae]MBL5954372.1 DUF4234 domain-containing protein [Enterobacter asburiae]
MTEFNINSLKNKLNTPTLHMALLSVVTNGIYPLMWLYKHQDTIMQETGQRFSSRTLVIWMAICAGCSVLLRVLFALQMGEYGYEYGEYRHRSHADAMQTLAMLLSLAWCVLAVVWSFKARAALRQYALNTFRFDLKMNPFYTLIFNMFYIMYCINDMPQAFAKHQIIYGTLLSVDPVVHDQQPPQLPHPPHHPQ